VKALYALGFVLFSFAAPAQTLETAIAGYHPGDCSGATTQQSAVSVQIIATEPTSEKPGEVKSTEAKPTEAAGVATTEPDDAKEASVAAVQPSETKPGEAKPTEADGVATTEPNDAKDTPVQAIQPSDENATVKHSALRDDKPTVDDTSGQNAMPAQIIATEPAIEKPGEAKPTEAKPTEAKPTETDGVATAAVKDAEDAPVEAMQPNDENAAVKSDREARN
jgi:hypothetical protein